MCDCPWQNNACLVRASQDVKGRAHSEGVTCRRSNGWAERDLCQESTTSECPSSNNLQCGEIGDTGERRAVGESQFVNGFDRKESLLILEMNRLQR
mmetsp:Transcript_61965/g.72468  ORF Transcript_61965/g.72468 Transcript_61965/m.72468 type:complete len:96 (+) Transcript_61965:360-647(+)